MVSNPLYRVTGYWVISAGWPNTDPWRSHLDHIKSPKTVSHSQRKIGAVSDELAGKHQTLSVREGSLGRGQGRPKSASRHGLFARASGHMTRLRKDFPARSGDRSAPTCSPAGSASASARHRSSVATLTPTSRDTPSTAVLSGGSSRATTRRL